MNKSMNSFVTFVVVELLIWIIVFDQIRKRITIYLEKDKNGEMKSTKQTFTGIARAVGDRNLTFSLLLVSSLAVRFGRIPKREKQRLLDEMQSYMNSLNESAAMDMDSPSVRENPTSTDDGTSKEAIGAISRAYRDIFTSNSSNQERASKSGNIISNNNNNTSPFSQDGNFPQVSSHPSSAQSYQSCPVTPARVCPVSSNHNQPAFNNMDSNRYTYLVSSNQNHNKSNATIPQRGSSANHDSFRIAGSTQNQPSCPWKLAPGAKVLVSTRRSLN